MLTDAEIRAAIANAGASPKRQLLWDTVARGLMIMIAPSGIATAYFVYRPPGKGSQPPTRLKLGRYPHEVTLAEGRRRTAVLRDQLLVGKDPAEERRAAMAEQARKVEAERRAADALASRLTVNKLAYDFLAAKSNIDWHDRYTEQLNRDVLPAIGALAAEDVTSADVARIIDAVVERGSRGQAVKVFEVVRSMFNWAVKRERLAASPVNGVEPPKKGDPRVRVLTNDEVGAFWLATERYKMPATVRRIMRLGLLTGQRVGEISEMARAELSPDMKTWTIPGKRTKNELPNTVPVLLEARKIFAEAVADAGPSRYVFPARRNADETDRPVATSTVSGVMCDLALWLLKTDPATGAPWVLLNDPSKPMPFTDPDTGEPSRIRMHDLRRTMATRMEELPRPVMRPVIEALLNHISGKNSTVGGKHYIHSDLTRMKGEAMARWENAVKLILAGGDPFKVEGADDVDAIAARVSREDNNNIAPLRVVS